MSEIKREGLLKAGDLIPTVQLSPITKEMLRAYAEASDDHNLIHLDEEVAKKSGLPGIIAHGMLSCGYLAERALNFVDEETRIDGLKLKSFQTRFKAMTLLGDVISITGSVKSMSAETGLALELQAKNQRGEITTTAVAKFL